MAITEIYVDPSLASNTGGGTDVDPYGDLQHALDTVTRDATNGDRFNIKAGTAEILAASLDLTTYGTPTSTAPIYFEGYTSVQGDGGIGEIDGNSTYGMFDSSIYDYVHIKDMKVFDCGSDVCIKLDNDCSCVNVEVTNSSGGGLYLEVRANIFNCYAHNVGGVAIFARADSYVMHNNIVRDGQTFTIGIDLEGSGSSCGFNRIEIDSTGTSSNGIQSQSNCMVFNNSIYAIAGTGDGIKDDGTNRTALKWFNNIIEGFSGTGGTGVNTSTGSNLILYGGNIFYNNATDESLGGDTGFSIKDNDTPASSPYTSASTGDMSLVSGQKAGAYPSAINGSTDVSYMDQGGIQREEPTGGSATQTSYGYFG
jgi:hypothetical protein